MRGGEKQKDIAGKEGENQGEVTEVCGLEKVAAAQFREQDEPKGEGTQQNGNKAEPNGLQSRCEYRFTEQQGPFFQPSILLRYQNDTKILKRKV